MPGRGQRCLLSSSSDCSILSARACVSARMCRPVLHWVRSSCIPGDFSSARVLYSQYKPRSLRVGVTTPVPGRGLPSLPSRIRPLLVGTVPGRKASRITPRDPLRTGLPVRESTRTSWSPGGTRNGMAGLFCSAASMNDLKIGAATEEPVSRLPRGLGLSNPT